MVSHLQVTTRALRVLSRFGSKKYTEEVKLSNDEMRFIFHNLSDESKLPKDFNPDCGGKLVYKLRGVSLKDYYGNEIVNIEKNPDFDVSYYFGVDHPNYCGMNQKQESEIDAKDTKAKTGKRHKALKGLLLRI